MTALPLLALRDIVVFPKMIVPLFVGRKRSIRALEKALQQDKRILVVSQKDGEEDNPGADGLYGAGVIAHAMQLLKLPDNTVKVLIEGEERASVVNVREHPGGFLVADTEPFPDEHLHPDDVEVRALTRAVKDQFADYAKLNSKISGDIVKSVAKIDDPVSICDTIGAHVNFDIEKKQQILEIAELKKRMEHLCMLLQGENHVLDTEKKIRSRVKDQMEKAQKEYYLNEQLKAIHKELNDGEGDESEHQKFEGRIKKAKMPKAAEEQARAELKRLKSMTPMSAEATVTRNYLDWLLDIPWSKSAKVKSDLDAAQERLDADHYGMEKVKERIVEYLAVLKRTKKMKGPVLCLYGPPGVGKTSLAQSVAEATGRPFLKIALGGVRDEAEIRGHRRTYIGAMPGKIIQSMKKAGAVNPLILLDEIDKMGHDYRGDPASALLEVLDPEQNKRFNDHYLEVDYDLSDVMFICTANSLNLPPPLLDRLEIIRLSGYTEEEKTEIARRHLIPKQQENHGLKEGEFALDDAALTELIRRYTREAGVRNLEREIAKLCRKALHAILAKPKEGEEKQEHVTVAEENLADYAGVPRFTYDRASDEDLPGVVCGLAYTDTGGDILFIEALALPGDGKIKSTGKLGEVMQESAQAAYSYMRARAREYGLTPEEVKKKDIHLHVPEGATPKDGPSAGVAMFIAVLSALSGVPVRRDVAMTGEITLRGRVLAIGGLKEKLLSALRGGINTVLIPKENEKDMSELPDNVKEGLEIIFVSHAAEAVHTALTYMPQPLPETDPQAVAPPTPAVKEGDGDGVLPH